MEVYENLSLEDLDGEIWKEIEEYNGDYFISNLGRVKSFKKHNGTDVRILEQNRDGDGYSRVKLSKKEEKPKTKGIHVLMYEYFIGEIPEGYVVHHIDFTKNNILENFQLVTDKEHKSLHDPSEETRKKMSENNSNRILTEQNVIQIRRLCGEGELTQKEIAKKFGVDQTRISKIKNKKTWKHLK